MKVFTCTFPGHYIGGVAVVVAHDEPQARIALTLELAEQSLHLPNNAVFSEVCRRSPAVYVLANGDY